MNIMPAAIGVRGKIDTSGDSRLHLYKIKISMAIRALNFTTQ